MLRNRIIHGNELVYVGPTFETGVTYSNPITSNLDKVQSISYSFGYERSDVGIVGKSRSVDRPISSSPLVNVNLDYILNSFHNENLLGLEITPKGLMSNFALLSGLADETDRSEDKRNLYLATTEEGIDLIGGETGQVESVLCFHNCQITNYSNSFSINEIPTASISFEGTSASYFSSGENLAVDIINKQSAASAGTVEVDIPMSGNPRLVSKEEIFIPGNISVDFLNADGSSITETGLAPITNDKVQSLSTDFSLNRNVIHLLDHKVIYDKLIATPIIGSASIDLIEHGSQSGDLTSFINQDKSYKIAVKVKDKDAADVMTLTFNEVRIDNISYSNSINQTKTSSVDFSFPVDPFDENKSINFSGSY